MISTGDSLLILRAVGVRMDMIVEIMCVMLTTAAEILNQSSVNVDFYSVWPFFLRVKLLGPSNYFGY